MTNTEYVLAMREDETIAKAMDDENYDMCAMDVFEAVLSWDRESGDGRIREHLKNYLLEDSDGDLWVQDNGEFYGILGTWHDTVLNEEWLPDENWLEVPDVRREDVF